MTDGSRFAVVGPDPVLLNHVRKRMPDAVTFPQCSDVAGAFDAIIVDLQLPDAVEYIRAWKTQSPAPFVAASLVLPKKELWESAESAGADFVANRGALMAQLGNRFEQFRSSAPARRIRLFHLQDVAGRLGVVHRLVDDAAGPIAVYHVKGSIFAAQDTCPHAGRLLSEGEVEEAVVTCPGHGSQFDVRNGTRMRGPADVDIATYRIVMEQQQVFLVFGGESSPAGSAEH